MKRKKFLALTLAAAMSLALFSGCSRPSASSGGNDNPSANNTGSTSSEAAAGIVMGGNVRVGFEDNIYLGKGHKAASNGELVAKVVRLSKELGREIANPGEARRILSLA